MTYKNKKSRSAIPGCFDTADLDTMKDYNLNPAMAWKDCMDLAVGIYITYRKSFNILIPGFMPSENIITPEGISHARILVSVVFIDLEKEVF